MILLLSRDLASAFWPLCVSYAPAYGVETKRRDAWGVRIRTTDSYSGFRYYELKDSHLFQEYRGEGFLSPCLDMRVRWCLEYYGA